MYDYNRILTRKWQNVITRLSKISVFLPLLRIIKIFIKLAKNSEKMLYMSVCNLVGKVVSDEH